MKFEIFASANKNPDILSKAIMEWLGTPYSHCGIIVNEIDIYHSIRPAIEKIHIEEFQHKRQFVKRIDITDKIKKDHDFLQGFLEGKIGVEYSELQYLTIMANKMDPSLQKIILSLVGNDKAGAVCSELSYDFLVTAGVIAPDTFFSADTVDPKMIVELVEHIVSVK